ncbi:MAG: OmpH family outer membrane protein [Cyclobacteriaceae bacterium]|nr:OmpH family outer membrane protein [Cyclobacteriaceae bacterium]
MKNVLFIFAFGLFAVAANAQTQNASKVGYADVDYIFSQMPEFKQIDAELTTLQNQLKKNLEAKSAEFQRKLTEYQQNAEKMLDAVRQNTVRELEQLQANLQKLQEDAQTEIQKKQNTLMEPVYAKVGKTIEEVAKENGFTFVLNQQIGGLDVILYGDPANDISDLVLKKMGITPVPATTTKPK